MSLLYICDEHWIKYWWYGERVSPWLTPSPFRSALSQSPAHPPVSLYTALDSEVTIGFVVVIDYSLVDGFRRSIKPYITYKCPGHILYEDCWFIKSPLTSSKGWYLLSHSPFLCRHQINHIHTKWCGPLGFCTFVD